MNKQTIYTESELVSSLKKKENEAYRYLYINYRGSLFNIINQIIPDIETSNDVLQEVFITVWNNFDKYDPGKGRLYTWLLNLTRNTAINKIRSKNYKGFLKNVDLSIYVNDIEQKENSFLNINQIGLRTEVHKLKDEFKSVLDLAYFHGCTQEEISKALNIPLGTVKTRIRNALIELRKHFK